MSLPYPRGEARAIADARARGMRPAGAIEIILTGGWHESPNPKCYADQDRIYCWDWLAGLNVVVLIDPKTRLDRILGDIDRAAPSQIDVIDHERKLGWLVNFTKPTLRTVRWPRAWVADWLGSGEWHRNLERIKAKSSQAANEFVAPKGFWPWN